MYTYDVVWCTSENEAEALTMVKRLTKSEISMRGLDGMHGYRVGPSAPLPADSDGRFCGVVGSCIMRNASGSAALAGDIGGVFAPDDDSTQRVALSKYIQYFDIIRFDKQGKASLIGGSFRPDLMSLPEFASAFKTQTRAEQHTKRHSVAMDAGLVEIFLVRFATMTRRLCVPVGRLLKWIASIRYLGWVAIPPSLILFVALLCVDAPALFACGLMRRVRASRRWNALDLDFDPFSTARSAMSTIAGPKIVRGT